MISRRAFLPLLAAPAIVRVSSLMALRGIPLEKVKDDTAELQAAVNWAAVNWDNFCVDAGWDGVWKIS